jgi:predicted DCC family thiol-disulfide oxidoreductase YuxK
MNLPDHIEQHKHIILFDGVCNLCSGFMQFVYKRDKNGIFKFAWLQDKKSVEILEWLNLSKDDLNTIVLIEEEKAYFKSTAFLRIIRLLTFPWPLLGIGYVIPRIIRDVIYDFVAKNRYKWFGKKENCLIPRGALLKRFL